MKGSDIVLLVLTFILGIFAGFYFYVQFYLPEYITDNPASISLSKEWSMNVSEMGICQVDNTCVQFQLNNNGNYSYQTNEFADITTGVLERNERRDANQLALGTDWYLTERSQTCSNTAVYWYQFDVLTEAERYQLALCSELFDDSTTYNVVEHFLSKVSARGAGSSGGSGSVDGDESGGRGWPFNRESTFRSPVQFWVYGLNYPGNDEIEE